MPPPIVLPWVVTAAILIGAGGWAFWPREAELRQPKKPGESGALIWGEGVFSSALELQAWLEARGVVYKEWARRHPEAVKLLVAEPGTVKVSKPKAKPTARKARAAKPKPGATKPSRTAQPKRQSPARPAARALEPTARTFSTSGGDGRWLVVALLGLLGTVGAALAATVSGFGVPSRAAGVGVGLMLSATCIGIGFAAAALLS